MVKQILFVVCGILFFINDVYSQDQKVIDSLQLVLKNRSGGERFLPLYELTFEYIQKDNEKALKVIQQAEGAALLSGDSLWIVKSKRVKGQILYFLERTQEANESFYAALPIAIRNDFTREWFHIESYLGKLNLFTGKYDKALMFYFKTLELAKQLEDSESQAFTFHEIGVAYYKLKDYQKGLDYFKKSFRLHEFVQGEAFFMLTNMGLCYVHLGDFSNARLHVERSLQDCGSDCSEESRINIEYAFGLIAQGEKQPPLAENHFLTSYFLAKRVNDTRFQLDNIYLLTEMYLEQKQFKKAEYYLLEAEKLINQNTPFNLEMIKIYSRFSELFMTIKNFEKASFYQSKYIQLKDSIYNEALTTSLMKTEAEYLERENIAKIAAQDEIILLKEEVINRQWILNILTGLLGMITFSFSIFLYRNYRQKKNLNILLDKKIIERTRELELSRNELIRALKERDLIISRASDGIAETINTIKGLCFTGINAVSEPTAHSYLDRIEKTSCRLADCLRSVFQEKIAIPFT